MKEFSNMFQSADWKKEKHAPVIEAPGKVKKGEGVSVNVMIILRGSMSIFIPKMAKSRAIWVGSNSTRTGPQLTDQIQAQFTQNLL